jgi:hypothetical protein
VSEGGFDMTGPWIKVLFIIAGLYDGLLGAIFLFFGLDIFRIAGVTPPNHIGYIQFPALLLIIFGFMFFRIAQDTVKNRELMLYGVALKAAYTGVVFWHSLHGGIPSLWIPWAWADVAFLVLFLVAWKQTVRG